jgi:beta-lactamase class A/beta-lactamase class A VEB
MLKYKSNMKYFITILWISICSCGFSQININQSLNDTIEKIILNKKATVGVVVSNKNGIIIAEKNGAQHFPMQSVFKFHIAIVMLSEIENGKFTLDQPIEIKKTDLLPKTWSPIRDKYPDGTTLTIREIIQYTVSQSDNNGCDILLRLLGGPFVVENYFKEKHFSDISIQINEAQMHTKWNEQFKNWITPYTSNAILHQFIREKQTFLNPIHQTFLLETMINTTTGMGRLKGLLPSYAVVAHKTGSSGANRKGITAAANDIGIVYVDKDNWYVISVFVTQSSEDEMVNDQIIAEINKAAWEYFSQSKP